MSERILVVDDELSMRQFLEILLLKEGYDVTTAAGGADAIRCLDEAPFDLVVTDVKMPDVDGLKVLAKSRDVDPDTIVIMITAFASMESAIQAMNIGAYDYITKPFKVEEIRHIIRNALEKKRLVSENILLRRELKSRYQFGNIIGSSKKMLEIFDLLQRVAAGRTSVLISGESGTGKELVARAIHFNSPRREEAFVTVNCGAIPENLLESELFGHKKGSFTGAISNKLGLFTAADGGTIFLDEVGELPLPLQVKLLRVLQEKLLRPLGEVQDVPVDVRVLSATNKNLEREVAAGQFREDLFYRLNVVGIEIPPLRERREDIPVLAQYFLEKYSKELEKDVVKISEEAMTLLEAYDFPGNVRELENLIERCVALEKSTVIFPEALPPNLTISAAGRVNPFEIEIPPDGINLEKVIGEIERDLLVKALAKAGGVRKKAAQLLNVTFRSLRYRLDKYGILPDEDGEDDEE